MFLLFLRCLLQYRLFLKKEIDLVIKDVVVYGSVQNVYYGYFFIDSFRSWYFKNIIMIY